ncbi:hypothetical protein B566_EDAN012019 [Ephemera danica]|nr:hypothetical protein B566_EDAN012019 [Ephemera danica]
MCGYIQNIQIVDVYLVTIQYKCFKKAVSAIHIGMSPSNSMAENTDVVQPDHNVQKGNELNIRLNMKNKKNFDCDDKLISSDQSTNRMKLGPQQALYLLVNNRSMASLSRTLAEVYQEHRDEDGFLYVTYASQEVFGGSAA